MRPIIVFVISAFAVSCSGVSVAPVESKGAGQVVTTMSLGSFSISLTVKDLKVSKIFYEKLGFVSFHGEEAHGWLIMKSGAATIGLFQGMFDANIMTFNPGWNGMAEELSQFMDVRDIQQKLEASGVALTKRAGGGDGPDSITIVDPDGNVILIDQHVSRPM